MAEQLPITTASNQQYGQRLAQQRAQEAVPMGQSPTTAPSPVPKKPRVTPGSLTSLTAPTTRPDEPITAGADFGPGPNSLAIGMIPQIGSNDDLAMRVRAIASQFPSAALLGLVAELESQ